MNEKLYLNYAVYNNGKQDYLVRVIGGYFASDAWMIGDAEYNDVAGSKFGGIFGDTGKNECCSKWNVRRLSSDEEFEKLLAKAHPALKMDVSLDLFLKRAVSLGIINKPLAAAIFHRESLYMPYLLEEMPNVKISQIVRWSRKVYEKVKL